MKAHLLACSLIALFSACTQSGLFQREKQYTPLYLYYNPLDPEIASSLRGSIYAPECNYPNFLNYPNDRLKHGLRGNVSEVSYLVGLYPVMEMRFNEKGNITYSATYLDKEQRYSTRFSFKYDDAEKLEGVYKNIHMDRFAQSHQKFEYDDAGKLIKRKGAISRIDYLAYSYHDNGMLKEITQVITDRSVVEDERFSKIEFNESGDLVNMNAPLTTNPLMIEAKNDHNELLSICTFSHKNGLCTEKFEKICFKQKGQSTDTIPCHNKYTYNDKGDIISWEYSGGYTCQDKQYRNYYSILPITFKIEFEYDYDQYDNWTTMCIVLPDDFATVDYLYTYYVGTMRRRPIDGEKPIVCIYRNIDYYAFVEVD